MPISRNTSMGAALGASAAALALAMSVGLGTAAAAPPKCSDVQGTQLASTCQIQLGDAGYSVDIQFPADYPDPKAPIYEYVKKTRDDFLNVAKSSAPRSAPYSLKVTPTKYSAAVPPRGTISVVLTTEQDTGGAHPTTTYKAFNWDQGLRKAMTIDTLWQAEANPFPTIYPLVKEELAKKYPDAPALGPTVGLDPQIYQNFAITNDTLIFFFDQGTVLPEAAGGVSVTIPRGPVDSMIA